MNQHPPSPPPTRSPHSRPVPHRQRYHRTFSEIDGHAVMRISRSDAQRKQLSTGECGKGSEGGEEDHRTGERRMGSTCCPAHTFKAARGHTTRRCLGSPALAWPWSVVRSSRATRCPHNRLHVGLLRPHGPAAWSWSNSNWILLSVVKLRRQTDTRQRESGGEGGCGGVDLWLAPI